MLMSILVSIAVVMAGLFLYDNFVRHGGG